MKDVSTSKIEQLIDEMEEFIESCKPQPFSQSKVVVPKDELYELLTELRLKTPEEIKRYQKIISNREKIINDAQIQAEQMVEETNQYVQQLVEEHEIMKQAYQRAQEVIDNANAQAEATVNAANEEAEAIRRSSLEYTADLINNLQTVIGRTIDVAQTNYDGLLNGLSYNLEVLTSNRESIIDQLQAPVEMPTYEPAEHLIPEDPELQESLASNIQSTEDFEEDDYDDID